MPKRGHARQARQAGPADEEPRATRKARELAALHGVTLASIEKRGFITAADVEALIGASATQAAASAGGESDLLMGLSTDGVSLPASWADDPGRGRLDPGLPRAAARRAAGFRRTEL